MRSLLAVLALLAALAAPLKAAGARAEDANGNSPTDGLAGWVFGASGDSSDQGGTDDPANLNSRSRYMTLRERLRAEFERTVGQNDLPRVEGPQPTARPGWWESLIRARSTPQLPQTLQASVGPAAALVSPAVASPLPATSQAVARGVAVRAEATLRNEPQAQAFLGAAFGDAGDHETAARYYQNAIDAGYGTPDAYVGLGFSLSQLGRRPEAAAAARAALRLDPGNENAAILLKLSTPAAPSSLPKSARDVFSRIHAPSAGEDGSNAAAGAGSPPRAAAPDGGGEIVGEERGAGVDAALSARQAQARAARLGQEAAVFARIEDYPAALKRLDAVQASFPSNATFSLERAFVLARMGRFDEGLAEARRAENLSRRPEERAKAHYLQAYAHAGLGHRREVLRELAEAVRYSPGMAPALERVESLPGEEAGLSLFEEETDLRAGVARARLPRESAWPLVWGLAAALAASWAAFFFFGRRRSQPRGPALSAASTRS
jgi:tetratricopeptide (TPR) repeat protein